MASLPRPPRLPFPLAAPPWPQGVPRPAPERGLGIDYDHEWSRRYPVRLLRAMVLDNVTRPLAQVLAPQTIRGLDQLRHAEAPLIFAANHSSHVDTPLLLTTLPVHLRHRTVVAAAADHFFDRRWKSALWSLALAAIPIERTKVNRRSADVAADLLADGWSLIIFPEGGRTPDGWTQPFRGGAAYLARRTGRPVVPVYLHGTHQILPKRTEHPGPGPLPPGGSGTESRGRRAPRRAGTTVIFGSPLTPMPGEDARRFSARVEVAVATLGREVTTDWWTARREAAAGLLPAPGGPDLSSWRRSWALGKPRPVVDSPPDVEGAPVDDDRPWPPISGPSLRSHRRR